MDADICRVNQASVLWTGPGRWAGFGCVPGFGAWVLLGGLGPGRGPGSGPGFGSGLGLWGEPSGSGRGVW